MAAECCLDKAHMFSLFILLMWMVWRRFQEDGNQEDITLENRESDDTCDLQPRV